MVSLTFLIGSAQYEYQQPKALQMCDTAVCYESRGHTLAWHMSGHLHALRYPLASALLLLPPEMSCRDAGVSSSSAS